MNYARELMLRLKGVEQKENPLEIIGLSPDILKLGLSNDDLYEHCRRNARFLFGKMHPDHMGSDGEASEIAKRYSEAFNTLEDRKEFDLAIAEFRGMHSYVRAEERTLRAVIATQRDQVASLKKSLAASKKDAAEGKNFRKWMRGYLFGHSLRVLPGEGAVGVAECRYATVVTFGFLFASGQPRKEVLPQVTALYEEKLAKSKRGKRRLLPDDETNELQHMINYDHLTAISVPDLIKRALRSGRKAPAIRWGEALALQDLGLSKVTGLTRSERGGVIQETHGQWTQDELKRYRAVLLQFSGFFSDRYVEQALIIPEKLPVQCQKLDGDGLSRGKSFHILGTVDFFTGFSLARAKSTESVLRIEIPEDVLLKTEPFLIPGRALVSMGVPDRIRIPNSDQGIERRVHKLREQKYCIYLSHIVINAA